MRPRTFWHTLIGTFTSAQYYRDILQAPVGFTVRFFIIAMILLGLTRAVYVHVKLVPNWKLQLTSVINQLERDFPNELVITWNGQSLQTSNQQIVEVPYPTSMKPETDFWPPVFGYIVPESISPPDFSNKVPSRSLFVASANQLFVSDSEGYWSDVPLHTVPGFDQEFTLSRATLPTFITSARNWTAEFWNWASSAVVFFSAAYVLLAGLWMSLLEGLFAYLVLRFSGLQLPYRKAVQVSFHLVIVAEVISQITLWLYGPTDIPLFSITFWSLFAYVIFTIRNSLTPTPTRQQ